MAAEHNLQLFGASLGMSSEIDATCLCIVTGDTDNSRKKSFEEKLAKLLVIRYVDNYVNNAAPIHSCMHT